MFTFLYFIRSRLGIGCKLQKQDAYAVDNSTPTIDVLSDCLIEKILCFLPFKEAARMSILSKTWLRAWLTHPNLEFLVDPYFQGNIKIMDTIMKRYRDRKVHIEKFKLSHFAGTRFPSIDKWVDIAVQNGVKHLVIKVATVSLPICTILASKSLRELVLESCPLLPVNGIVVPTCVSLRKLTLSHVDLDENMFQTLLNSCPLIVSFIFEYCSGLEKIELLNLQKIKSISISTQRECSVKIRAPTLEHLYYSCYLLDQLDVVECHNLKSLNLSYVCTSDGYLQHLISQFQSLEVLKIQTTYEGMTEIDSPNLVLFEYTGDQIPQLITLRESNHSKIVLHCYDNLNDEWFCKLKKFLSNSTSWSQVSLYFPKCNMINMKKLQPYNRDGSPRVDVFVATPHVEILNVDILLQNEECPMFVDALLRSCHPRRLNLHSSIEMITSFIRCLLIMYTKNSSLSSSQGSKLCWHSQLTKIQAFDEKNQPLQLRSDRDLAISTLTERKEVYFLLDWRCN